VAVTGRVVRPDRYEGTLAVDIPYRSLWFTARDGNLSTTLTLEAELKTADGTSRWKSSKAFDIVAEEEDLKARRDESYRMELPLVLEGDLGPFRAKKGTFQVSLKNSTEGEILRKAVDFRLDQN
jgi:hypothetical protein